MINAKKCREQSEENVYFIQKEKIEQQLRKAIKKGRTKFTFADKLNEKLLDELKDAGFTVGNGIIEW